MGRIFILSNRDGLMLFAGDGPNYLGLDALCDSSKKHGIKHICNQQHTLYYNSDENIFQSKAITDSKIIVIHDFSYLTEIDNFTITDSDYLLYHYHGDVYVDGDEEIYSIKFGLNKKKGMHEPYEVNKYEPVFQKIFDNSILPQNKAGEIIKFLFHEKKKLDIDIALRHSRLKQNITQTAKQ